MVTARRCVDEYGFDLVVAVLDELTAVYGWTLDKPRGALPDPREESGWSWRGAPTTKPDIYGGKHSPEIKSPAGFILAHVKMAAEEMVQHAESQSEGMP